METNDMTVRQALTLAMSTGRSEFVRGLDPAAMDQEDVVVLRDLLADQIEHNATNYTRYRHLNSQARAVAASLFRSTMQDMAKLVAVANPNVSCDIGVGSEHVRGAMMDVLTEWHEAGVFTLSPDDFQAVHQVMDPDQLVADLEAG